MGTRTYYRKPVGEFGLVVVGVGLLIMSQGHMLGGVLMLSGVGALMYDIMRDI